MPEYLFKEWSTDENGKYVKIIANKQICVCHGPICHRLIVQDGRMEYNEVEALYCNAEEADIRMLIHAKHAPNMSTYSSIVVRASDTDVAVLSIYFQSEVDAKPLINRKKKGQSNHIKWQFIDISATRSSLWSGSYQTI